MRLIWDESSFSMFKICIDQSKRWIFQDSLRIGQNVQWKKLFSVHCTLICNLRNSAMRLPNVIYFKTYKKKIYNRRSSILSPPTRNRPWSKIFCKILHRQAKHVHHNFSNPQQLQLCDSHIRRAKIIGCWRSLVADDARVLYCERSVEFILNVAYNEFCTNLLFIFVQPYIISHRLLFKF